MATSSDSLLSSPHGGKSFVPKNYNSTTIGRHDARNSVKVKTNHSGDVPHFIYEGLLTNPNRIEEDLINDPMNPKSSEKSLDTSLFSGIAENTSEYEKLTIPRIAKARSLSKEEVIDRLENKGFIKRINRNTS
mgnify:CR=1 FL=1